MDQDQARRFGETAARVTKMAHLIVKLRQHEHGGDGVLLNLDETRTVLWALSTLAQAARDGKVK